jgi:hypothetical protein
MPTLFAFSDGNISTIGSLNSAATTIANQGVIGSQLSATRALAATTSYTNNTLVYGVALCLSSVGTINPGETLRIRLSTVNYDYNATGLSPGSYTNSFVTTAPQAMVGWVLFKLPTPVSFTAAPPLSVFGPNTVRLMGSAATTPASILVYGPYASASQPADIVYLTKSLTTGLVTEGRNVSGFLSAANVYICDGVKSENNFNISNNASNNIYIGRGGLFTGTAIVTGLNMAHNQFIHVLDGAVLSANYPTPTVIGRIKAANSAIVDLNNVVGFNMLSAGLFNNSNNTGNNIITYDYLHDITSGYARFRNTTFWSGITASNKNTNTANLSVYDSTFQGKYFHSGSLTATNTVNFTIKSGTSISNVLLTGIDCKENTNFEGLYNNCNIESSTFAKELNFNNSNFSNSNFTNVTFSSNSAADSITMIGNSSLPTFNNVLISNRKTGLNKSDTCNLYINGLSCLSSYFHSISANNLTGELNGILLKDSSYGMYDVVFNSTAGPLTINGLTATRAENLPFTAYTTTGTSVLSAISPFTGLSSLALSSLNTRVEINMPRLLSYNDDFTFESWYYPISAKLGTTQSLFSIWDQLSTTAGTLGCVMQMYINTTGQLLFQKGLSANGSTAPGAILTAPTTDALFNNRWYHIALLKSANTYSIYIDGLLSISAVAGGTNDFDFFRSSNPKVYLGARPSSRTLYTEALSGYLGAAKMSYGVNYTDTFTPTTNPFVTDDGTIFNFLPGNSATYSKMPKTFIDIENNKSYYSVSLNGLKFSSNNTLSTNLIDISNSFYEKFEINASDLSTLGKPLVMRTNVDYTMGSYVFNGCSFINQIVDASTINGYQPYTYRETGFAVQYANGDPNNHYRWTRGGKVSLDSVNLYFDLPTEKLESISDEYYLRSNLKLIPVSPASNVKGISLTYKTPVDYVSGGSLKIDKNTVLGVSEEVTLSELAPTNNTWATITVSLSDYKNPFWPQKSYLESYVELIGTNNQLHIAKWQASTI